MLLAAKVGMPAITREKWTILGNGKKYMVDHPSDSGDDGALVGDCRTTYLCTYAP